MRWVLLLVIAWCAPARADDGTHAQAVALVEAAHDAAVAGNCTTAHSLADQARELDDQYYQVAVVPDRAITECVQTATALPVAPPPPKLPPAREPIPPLGGRAIGEVAVGYAASVVGLIVGGAIGWNAGDSCGDACVPTGALIGAYAGGVMMLTVGVYAIGSIGNQRGSFGSTLAGGLIGGSAALFLAVALANNDISEAEGTLMAASLIIAPMAGALIGFNRTRAWDSPAGSLVQLQAGRVTVGVPLVARGHGITTVPLFAGSF